MSRLEYAKFFFTGKKSDHMISIERRYPNIKPFLRRESFFHAFGNITFYDGGINWIILLPACQNIDYYNDEKRFALSCKLFTMYWSKTKKAPETTSNDPQDNAFNV